MKNAIIPQMGLLYDLIFGVFVLTGISATFGHYLDKKFNTSPWLSVIFGLLAIIFGLARLVIKSNEIAEKNSQDEKSDKSDS